MSIAVRSALIPATLFFLSAGAVLVSQSVDRELVATISGPTLQGGIVSGLAWDGATLVIQTAAMDRKNGGIKLGYLMVPGKGMELRPLASPPPGIDKAWKLKSSRTSPTGLGKIELKTDSKLPLYGIASQGKRFADAMDMGGAVVTTEVRLGNLVIHKRRDVEPYDGEVWGWSSAELNRVCYVDEKGDLWVASADGRSPARVLKGHFTLPAWSDDGGAIAVVELKGDGGKWEVSVVHLPERYRRNESPFTSTSLLSRSVARQISG
ncbi:MAG TPA: hypothetical protein VGK32_07425 [Vicinamibacterales bacterium]|jgi:hypothetical protein